MKLKTVLFLALLFCIAESDAQSDRFYQTTGYSFSYFRLSAFKYDNNTISPADQYSGYGISYNYRARFNLYDINDNNSISVAAIPAIGLDYGSYENNGANGIMGFEMPLLLAFNTGAGSTYNTSSNFGFGLGVGLDMRYVPIVILEGGEDADFKRFYVDPCIQLNVRYWKTSTNALREFFIRYNFSSNGNDLDSINGISNPFAIVIGWMSYLNY